MSDEYTWRKSSRSAYGECVEVGARWRKSSYSSETANCVEVAEMPEVVAVRDSKNPDGGMLVFDEVVWRGFVAAVRAGNFDR